MVSSSICRSAGGSPAGMVMSGLSAMRRTLPGAHVRALTDRDLPVERVGAPSHAADDAAPSDADDLGLGPQLVAEGGSQEPDRQLAGERRRLQPDHREARVVERGVAGAEHGGPADDPAGTQVALVRTDDCHRPAGPELLTAVPRATLEVRLQERVDL